MISLKTNETRKLIKQIGNDILLGLNYRIRGKMEDTLTTIKLLIFESIYNAPEFNYLRNSQYAIGQLGIPEIETRLADVATQISERTTLNLVEKKNALLLQLRAIPVSPTYLYENLSAWIIEGANTPFCWLQQLLENEPTIYNFTTLTSDRVAAYSRTHTNTIMVRSRSKFWSIRNAIPQLAAQANDTFITRALPQIEPLINKTLLQITS